MNFFFTSIDTKEAVEAKKKYQDKYFINESDIDVYKWCEDENVPPIRFNENGEVNES